MKFEDDEFGFGGMAGVMLEPIQGTRFGVTYTSPVELDFKDTPSIKNLGPGFQFLKDNRGLFTRRIDLGLTVPQAVMLSGYHKINSRLAIMGNLVWQNWSAFGKPDISVASTNVSNETVNLNYDDTWGFALGTQCAFADGWLGSFGGGYDSSPVSKSARSPSLPMDEQFRIGTGIPPPNLPRQRCSPRRSATRGRAGIGSRPPSSPFRFSACWHGLARACSLPGYGPAAARTPRRRCLGVPRSPSCPS